MSTGQNVRRWLRPENSRMTTWKEKDGEEKVGHDRP
jgi:hypothetical protein